MSPYFSADNFVYEAAIYTHILCNRYRTFLRRKALADFRYCGFSKFCTAMRHSPFSDRILYVLRLRTEEQMFGIYARGIIPARAVMTDVKTFWYRTLVNLPGDAMRQLFSYPISFSDSQCSVPFILSFPLPKPTTSGFSDFCTELGDKHSFSAQLLGFPFALARAVLFALTYLILLYQELFFTVSTFYLLAGSTGRGSTLRGAVTLGCLPPSFEKYLSALAAAIFNSSVTGFCFTCSGTKLSVEILLRLAALKALFYNGFGHEEIVLSSCSWAKVVCCNLGLYCTI
jgi:hypothetical protein